jgi:hypothetical protein
VKAHRVKVAKETISTNKKPIDRSSREGGRDKGKLAEDGDAKPRS